MMTSKSRILTYLFLIIGTSIILTLSCKKEDETRVPEVSTVEVKNISMTTARSGGNITSDGGAAITSRGVCWNIGQEPTIANSKTSDGTEAGSFTSVIRELAPNTRYLVRAYATNVKGTGYGDIVSFNTASSLTPESTQITGSTFMMGSEITEPDRSGNETQHLVVLSGFRMSIYEITNAQYAEFLNDNNVSRNGINENGNYPSQKLVTESSENWDWGLHYSDGQWIPAEGYENHPVINVSWYGAADFAKYCGGRLPTEAEWEYACRANTNGPFNTGGCLSKDQANYNWAHPYSTCNNENSGYSIETQSTGSYAPNAWGLFDMHGNAWEWCSDYFGMYPSDAQTNPTGPASGESRIVRGGGYSDDASFCRSAARGGNPPEITYLSIGFRIVLPQ
jgi:formylglycine-generating enzyme required for sulfatase activity